MARRRADDDEADDDTPKVPSDAYVGMLGIATAALAAAAVLLYLDFDDLGKGSAQPPTVGGAETGLVAPAPAARQ